MPIYEYQCDSCGHELERLQRISDNPLEDCPDCGEADLRRLVSAAGFRLKGAGWYETDFKKDGKKNLHDSGSSKKPESGAGKTDRKKSESAKPAASAKSNSKPAAASSSAS